MVDVSNLGILDKGETQDFELPCTQDAAIE
jgi:hypothetical protein